MKRLFCVLLTLVLLLPLTALAERGKSVMAVPWYDEVKPLGSSKEKFGTQYCTVWVKVVQENADGTTTERVISPIAFSLTYKVLVQKRSGLYSGVELMRGDWPSVTLINNTVYDLDVSVKNVKYPDDVVSHCKDTTWSIEIAGGLLEVTYNEVIYLDKNGSQIDETSYTEKRCHYFTMSGGEASE